MKSIVMTKACSVINAAGIYERFTPEHGVYTLDDATANKLLALNGYADSADAIVDPDPVVEMDDEDNE